MISYLWTDGNNKDFQSFYQKTEEYYNKIAGGLENRKDFVPYNISDTSKEIYYLIKIELLSEKNFSIKSLDSYNRKQDVNKVYRRIDGEYLLIECKYTEDWNLN